MGKINVLSTEISNKIAAGEVVERPVSVVKELVENSIDAGANAITVEIKNGGTVLIKVTDNGSGMDADDAAAAFLRHATSKISVEDDLDAIYTLGFRGEALSSIGAVARVDLYTKQADSDMGTHVKCYGGEIEACEDAGCPNGTVFEVKNLFYNTPARMKFLKKDATEASHISDLMERYILAYPNISFRLISNSKQQLFSPGDNSLKNAVYTVYGKDYANAMIEVDYTIDKLHVSGMVGKGNLARPNRNFQSYFVNRRYIKSAIIIKATEEAYKNQIMIGKYPVAILNIDVNPSQIDINVHPTKLEVKFSKEKEIYELVYYGVKNALYELPNVPKLDIKQTDDNFKKEKGEQISVSDMSKLIPTQDYKSRFNPFEQTKKATDGNLNAAEIQKTQMADMQKPTQIPKKPLEEKPHKSDALAAFRMDGQKSDFFKMTFKSPTAEKISTASQNSAYKEIPKEIGYHKPEPEADTKAKLLEIVIESDERNTSNMSVAQNESGNTAKFKEDEIQSHDTEKTETQKKEEKTPIRICGQIFETYIIAQRENEVIIIDQHAAHERLKYEELKSAIEDKKIFSQIFLEPVLITLSPDELDVFTQNKEVFENAGFEADIFGNREIIVRSAPADLEWSDTESLVIELLTQLSENKKEIISKKQERFMYTIACKAAIKANHILSNDEMKKLVENILALQNINTCPHGRPIMISMTKYEMEKQFKRIT